MTALREILLRRIAATGPIGIADYMTECLLHPVHGYYTTRDPLGTSGDFTTAPEISQMFGELIGLALAQAWLEQGAPAPFALVEPGPGRGTLMADMLRATARVPGFHAALRLHLVEASPTLRAAQAERLPDATWHDRLDQIPDDLPLFLVANEFFDALPIRQFIRDGSGWRERVIGRDGDRLVFGLTAPAPLTQLEHRLANTLDGDMVEISPALPALVGEIGARIAENGGAALIVDYGGRGTTGDSFQAVQDHHKVDPLDAPGAADLTAHVDFDSLARAAAPAACAGPVPQGVFLERLGITARAQALAARLEGAALDRHVAAHRRLTHPEEMGDLFKVAALHPCDAPPPPGFET
ncbi:SAM-dependent MidA family methyltransferase [Limimaricola variabilis]|uniref:SAM-dependent MidA family methyltransferase n=1 Tax=Limimaricola variabilis TaxID=1492771 RepID=A0ABR6HP79_9RHOB|nr:SAM-dependent methyltransferase [Limimaricola variabilis]MBB3712287.1 SAM-dependent MidA family methyltransferase [Limimaricola variabilis]